jgi:hypothetical protein
MVQKPVTPNPLGSVTATEAGNLPFNYEKQQILNNQITMYCSHKVLIRRKAMQ